MTSEARVAAHPILSSPKQLSLAAFGVTLVVYAVQIASGIPPWLAGAPVELSSNVVAVAGLAWAMIQLRAVWRDRASRLAWGGAAGAMALLSVEGYVGPAFLFETHGQEEMSLSIVLWLIAAGLLFSTARRFAMRRSVEVVTRCGFAIQIAAQLTGFWAATLDHPEGDLLEYLTDTGELVAVLAYLMALLLAVFSPDKSYRFPLEAIGRKTRGIVRDFKLHSLDGPRLVWSAVSVRASALTSLARCWSHASAKVAHDGGPSRARQLFELSHVSLIGGVDPTHYYRLRLFGEPEAADGVLTKESGAGLARALRRAADDGRDLDDGLSFARTLGAAGLPAAPILAIVSAGRMAPAGEGRVDLAQDLVVRPRSGAAPGPHLTLAHLGQSVFRDPQGDLMNLDMVVSRLGGLSAAGDLLVGPRLAAHDEVAAFARGCALDFQVVTCLDEDGAPRVTHGVMRMRQGGGDAPAVDWGAPIDLLSGAYGLVSGGRLDGGRRLSHPVTGDPVAGRICTGWRAIADLAVAAHRIFDQDVVTCWTIAWTPEGPCLVKGETDLDFSFVQRCYGAPIGRSPLAPLLDWRLDRVIGRDASGTEGGTRLSRDDIDG